METPTADRSSSSALWSIAAEVDWGKIDLAGARSDTEQLMLVRRAALAAARRTVGLSHLLCALATDSIASALLAREIHDSWKHFHALRSYLDVAEYAPAIEDAELDRHRRAARDGTVQGNENIGRQISQLLAEAARDGAAFALIRGRARDPALAKLADRISSDRERHSLALASYLSAVREESRDKTA